jgi:4,5-dihydroxyphthalate decarboxylase
LFGADPFAYGVTANRAGLEAVLRWSFMQGITARQLAVEELFAGQTLDWDASKQA